MNFLQSIHPEIISKEFITLRHQMLQDRFQWRLGREILAQDVTIWQKAQSSADICEKAVAHDFIISGGYSVEFYGWTAKTANIGTAIR